MALRIQPVVEILYDNRGAMEVISKYLEMTNPGCKVSVSLSTGTFTAVLSMPQPVDINTGDSRHD